MVARGFDSLGGNFSRKGEMMEIVIRDKWSELVDFVEEHGGSLSGESRDRLWHIVTDENVVTVEDEPMDDDALMELFGNVKEQLDRLKVITDRLARPEITK